MQRGRSTFTAGFLLLLFCAGSAVHAEQLTQPLYYSPKFLEAKRLTTILEQPEDTIDFARAKLAIDKMVDPTIDVKANLKKIDAIVKQIKALLPAKATSTDKMLAVKKYIYEAGTWNNFQPYHYDFDDPSGTIVGHKLLPNYLASKKGNCVSMPLLFIVLGQRLGIDVTASTAPKHVLVKYTDSDTGQTYNLETTSGANPVRDVWYQQTMHVTDQALENRIYLQKLSKQESLAVMATVLAESYYEKQDYEKAMMISDVVLKHNSNAVDTMLMKGSLFYKLLSKHYLNKYPTPNLIPVVERPYFEFLDINNRFWFEKAEKLGWREPTQADEINYLNKVKHDANLLQIQ